MRSVVRTTIGARLPPRKIIVAGAGLAGLTAAYELSNAGHEVVVLESRGHAGGRVRTLRSSFADGLYAEAGGQGFFPVEPNYAAQYAEQFGLRPEPAGRGGLNVFHLRGRTVRLEGLRAEWPVDLTAEERSLGLSGLRAKYLAPAVAELRSLSTPDGWSPAAVDRFDGVSFAELLRSRGASGAAVELLRLSDLDFVGEGAEHYSALDMFGQLYNVNAQAQTLRGNVFAIAGGNDLLPAAFANRLKNRIHYGAALTAIEWSDRRVSAHFDTLAGRNSISGDYLIVALPFSVLRSVEVSPPFSRGKVYAIASLSYNSLARTYVQCARRSWNDDNLSGMATTDLETTYFWDSTVVQVGTRGILQGYIMGSAARRFAKLDQDQQRQFALDQLSRVFPQAAGGAEIVASISWDHEPWTRGGYAWLRPGEGRSIWPHLRTPEGRVHFAGEHTSTWLLHSCMQGALESGVRVAKAVNDHARRTV